ncbi:TPA: site-specific DNA-methyltransferase [Pseudomonas aeruginosa]|uniref:DNA-methyltransferase n=1 Tax=Pseudomonas aeruginosa TaxID=287 RepID=UPI0003B97DB1|nr:site-specific DNA-methyltransferase [Pseudomonas aeruginosa]ERY76309.1 hypothetical protein Q029_03156 [Pseudomonas aeruginosa BWHPSA016]RUF44815.1 site-specific DNA-methyltransferase [Pseudomonas aeruginosa]HCF4694580.1 site-specific DNA-methyltransferase [Pseudomonas aeruginosa]
MTLSHEIRVGDCLDALRAMPDQSFHCCITSPPYFGLRDYGMASQIGLEQTPTEFVARLVDVFREVRRVLRDDGTLWLNIGDSYASTAPGTRNAPQPKGSKENPEQWGNFRPDLRDHGIKPKDLIGIPWRLAFALQDDGWHLRQDIIWHKPNPMPESVRDRCTKAHEYLFLLSKSPRYHFDQDAIAEPMKAQHRPDRPDIDYSATRNKRSVWTVPTAGFKGAHFATFPPDLIRPCVLAGAPRGGLVLDPFGGAGTTALVAMQEGRRSVLIELNPEYAAIARNRLDTAWLEGAAQLDLLHDQKESVA